MQYDVLVVGAGPAGSTAARACAARGLRVAVLDRAEFPRDKPCGGGVNVRAARLLPFSLGAVTERTIYGLAVSVRQHDLYVRRWPEPLSFLTQRRRLDAYLLEQAIQAGASLFERRSVRAVEQDGSWVVVRAGGEQFTARALVAADGANGPTAKLAGMEVPRLKGIALEANVSPNRYPAAWQDTYAVDVGDAPGGYGWLFPKGDHLNVGVGGWHSSGPTLRRRLEALTRFYGFEPAALWGQRGHPLPVRRPDAPLVRGNVLAVGDAAGLLDPLTGEGIYAALWSGMVAARYLTKFAASGSLAGYAAEVHEGLLAEQRIALQLRDLFHVQPTIPAALLKRSPHMWSAVCRLLTGDMTYLDVKRRFPGLATGIDLTSDLVRVIIRGLNRPGAEDTLDPESVLRPLARILPPG